MNKRQTIGSMGAAALVVAIGLFVAPHEGTGPTARTASGEVVAQAYPDPAHGWAVPTICQGHTRGVFKGQTASKNECELFLAADIADIALPALQKHVRVPVTPAQAVALGDFVFNLGEANFARSTLLKKLNAGDCEGAAKEFSRWDKAGKERLPGLAKRREAERAQFAADCIYWRNAA
jgi:lysozyme